MIPGWCQNFSLVTSRIRRSTEVSWDWLLIGVCFLIERCFLFTNLTSLELWPLSPDFLLEWNTFFCCLESDSCFHEPCLGMGGKLPSVGGSVSLFNLLDLTSGPEVSPLQSDLGSCASAWLPPSAEDVSVSFWSLAIPTWRKREDNSYYTELK